MGAHGDLGGQCKTQLATERQVCTHAPIIILFSGRSWTISTFARRSICSPSQFVHLHGKPCRLSFEREVDGPALVSVRVITTIDITNGRNTVSPSRSPCDSDGTAPISVRVIATIGITHSRKTVSPSRNPCDSDPFLVALIIEHQRCQVVRLHGTNTDYFFSGRSSIGSTSMGADLLFAFYLPPSITLELRASLLAGGFRFHFFYVVWSCMVCTKLK